MASDIFSYIIAEEAAYKTTQVPIAEGYEWNMDEHVRKSTLYRDSRFTKGSNDGSRPFKNILRRIRTLQIVATGFDVKDIEPFVNSSKDFYKSFLTRKYHPKWARKHNLDTFIDELVESYVDFGLALVKRIKRVAPEVVQLQSLAFCDQTDILSGPICIKHQYSPAQLKDMESKGWGSTKNGATISIDELIMLARKEKVNASGVVTKTPGKFIEVYELDGTFPKAWLKDQDISEEDETTYSPQFGIFAFYKDDKGDKKGVKLFHGKGDPEKYKALKRDPIFGRACGFGCIEEGFEAQVWTNYNMIRIQGMLDACSKLLGVTDDASFAAKTKITDMDNGEWLVVGEGKKAAMLNNQPINIKLFENAVAQWEEHAQQIGSANDALLGETPNAGTPFKLQELITYQGKGPHEYRKGKVATFLSELYRDWILGDLVSEMNDEQEFIEELTLDEMNYVADCLADHQYQAFASDLVIHGQPVPTEEEKEAFKEQIKEGWHKGGTKRFFKLLQDELKGLPVDVEMNIAGKQKNLSGMADKLTNIFRMVTSNPQGFVQTMQIPGMSNTFNDLMEASGLSPVNFAAVSKQTIEEMGPQKEELSALSAEEKAYA